MTTKELKDYVITETQTCRQTYVIDAFSAADARARFRADPDTASAVDHEPYRFGGFRVTRDTPR
jgi:hypothetical protein